MHICFLTHEYPPASHGGIGTFIQTMGRALVEQGHQVSVLGLYPIRQALIENDQGVRVMRLAESQTRLAILNLWRGYFILWREINALHRQQPIDVLEGNELSFGLLPPLPNLLKLIRMQGGHHFFAITLGRKPRRLRAIVERLSFARADAYCAITQYIAKVTMDLLGKSQTPVTILPNPVDISKFRIIPVQKSAERIIVFIGTVTRKKGVFELVAAMPTIVQSNPDAVLWLIGRDHEDTMALLKASIAPEFAEKIIFWGQVAHEALPAMLASAEVCVFPSYMEGQGIVVIEGMAMGKAVVSSQTGPGPEIIEHGVTGLLCNPYDPQSIAEQVIHLLQDENLRIAIGQAARKQVEEKYALDKLVQQNIHFYHSLIKGKKGDE